MARLAQSMLALIERSHHPTICRGMAKPEERQMARREDGIARAINASH